MPESWPCSVRGPPTVPAIVRIRTPCLVIFTTLATWSVPVERFRRMIDLLARFRNRSIRFASPSSSVATSIGGFDPLVPTPRIVPRRQQQRGRCPPHWFCPILLPHSACILSFSFSARHTPVVLTSQLVPSLAFTLFSHGFPFLSRIPRVSLVFFVAFSVLARLTVPLASQLPTHSASASISVFPGGVPPLHVILGCLFPRFLWVPSREGIYLFWSL